MAENIVLSNTEYKVVGTRPIRHDGTDKVTGRAKYGADFQAAGMLFGKVLRSPHAHARIKSIDTSQALAVAGVKAIITGQDMPGANKPDAARGTQMASDNVMARAKGSVQRTRHRGDRGDRPAYGRDRNGPDQSRL